MVAGRMEHYRSAPVRLGEQMTHAPDTAARLGQPAEVWYAVWLDGYHTIIDPINGLPAASFAGTRPRRVRRITPTGESTPHANHRAAVMSPPEEGTGRPRLRCDRRHPE
jgi:hypothetical protein